MEKIAKEYIKINLFLLDQIKGASAKPGRECLELLDNKVTQPHHKSSAYSVVVLVYLFNIGSFFELSRKCWIFFG